MTTLTPRAGSTGGGAWATITGADFERGATVRLGEDQVQTQVSDSATIVFWTTAHAAGIVDVVVTNPGGLEDRLVGGYTYAPADSFDFNGDWLAHVGPDFGMPMRFTVRHNVLVSVSCDTSGALTLAPAPEATHGEVAYRGADGVSLTGTLLSPLHASGTIDVPGVPTCRTAHWWAEKIEDDTRSGDLRLRR